MLFYFRNNALFSGLFGKGLNEKFTYLEGLVKASKNVDRSETTWANYKDFSSLVETAFRYIIHYIIVVYI